MSEAKKAETKNQHYVPQFYQRFFSADPNHKSIGAYVIKSRKYIHAAPIKNQSSGDYFYSDNQKIEGALGAMEGLASEVFQKIFANPKSKLTDKDWYTAYAFTFMQIGRTLDRANLIQSTADSTAKLLLKKYVEAKRNSADAEKVDTIEGIKHDGGEIVGTVVNSIFCKLHLSFVKELPTSKAITPHSYNPLHDRLRPIAYIKDQLIMKYKAAK